MDSSHDKATSMYAWNSASIDDGDPNVELPKLADQLTANTNDCKNRIELIMHDIRKKRKKKI